MTAVLKQSASVVHRRARRLLPSNGHSQQSRNRTAQRWTRRSPTDLEGSQLASKCFHVRDSDAWEEGPQRHWEPHASLPFWHSELSQPDSSIALALHPRIQVWNDRRFPRLQLIFPCSRPDEMECAGAVRRAQKQVAPPGAWGDYFELAFEVGGDLDEHHNARVRMMCSSRWSNSEKHFDFASCVPKSNAATAGCWNCEDASSSNRRKRNRAALEFE